MVEILVTLSQSQISFLSDPNLLQYVKCYTLSLIYSYYLYICIGSMKLQKTWLTRVTTLR